jgi:hypothetical protein
MNVAVVAVVADVANVDIVSAIEPLLVITTYGLVLSRYDIISMYEDHIYDHVIWHYTFFLANQCLLYVRIYT